MERDGINDQSTELFDHETRCKIEIGAYQASEADMKLEREASYETQLRSDAEQLLDGLVERANKQRRRRSIGEAVIGRFKTKLTMEPIPESGSYTQVLTPLIYPESQQQAERTVTHGWQFGTQLESRQTAQMINRLSEHGLVRTLSIYRTTVNNANPSDQVSEKWYDIVPRSIDDHMVYSYPPAKDRELDVMKVAQKQNPNTYQPEPSVLGVDGSIFLLRPIDPRDSNPMHHVPTAGRAAIEHCYVLVQEGLRSFNL